MASTFSEKEEELNGKIKIMANAWQSSETTQQHKMSLKITALPQDKFKLCGTSALVMVLSNAAVKTAHENAIAEPDVKRFTRVSFVVLRILHPGWSTVPANAEAAALLISAGKNAKNVPSVALGEMMGTQHCLVYSFAMLKRGAYQKGLRTDETAAISPGMVFTLKAWSQNVSKIFKDQTEDLQPFEIAVAQLMLRSNNSSKMDEMLDLKSITSIRGASPAALRLIDATLLPGSMQEAAIMRSRFGDGTYLSPEERGGAAIQLKQEWIKGNLSGTVSAMHVPLTFGSGSFAIGPDDILRFHIDTSSSAATIMGDLGCTSIMVYYDKHQFEGAPLDWTVAFFNVALMLDAIDLIVSVDTYQGKDSSSPVLGFVRVQVAAITSALLKNPPMVFESVPKKVTNVILAGSAGGYNTLAKHLAVYAFADNKIHFVVDTRRISRRPTDAPSSLPTPTISMVHMETQSWQKGYNVNVFVEERLVFQFVAAADSAAGSSITAARGLQTIAMMVTPSFVNFDTGDDTVIDDDATTTEEDATTTAATAIEEEDDEANKHKKRSTTASTGGGKRTKRLPTTTNDE